MKDFVYIFCLLIFLSCTKEKLPRATESGKNTFGCKIDGEVFIPSEPETGWSGTTQPILVDNTTLDGFFIRAKKNGSSLSFNENVIIRLPYLTNEGTYELKTFGYGEYYEEYSGSPKYRTNNTFTGTVKITRCDNVNKIYSGTFSFKGIDETTGKVVNVTDGRFDVKRP